MTPTLIGRIQTRLFLLLVIGLPWTILVTPLLPRHLGVGTLGGLYATTLTAWFLVGLLGCCIWEPLYHLGQQFRWEKDWPILFGLLTSIPEALVLWSALPAYDTSPASGWTFCFHFFSTWIVMWLFAIGPIKIFLIRYRFRGGRIL
ncbi:MAG: hypothetical protein IT196_08670 [Acidimicrobiales bacterium]|nr:hypothetical protein [Acidimicrobiales bacterium]